MKLLNLTNIDTDDPQHFDEYPTTNLAGLANHIKTLATVKTSDGPFISCYLNITPGTSGWQKMLDKKADLFRKILNGPELDDFNECISQIKEWLHEFLLPTTKGVAIFARGIRSGYFWLPMQFAVSLPNYMTIYPTPNIYHLVELKDNYNSYILMIARKEGAYIMEVNLGEASIQSWIKNRDIYKRVGTEWSKMHYQVNKANRESMYFEEKVAIIRKLMNQNNLAHLILAGDPKITNQFKRELPADLKNKLVDVVPCGRPDEPSDVILATISSFLDYEEQESQMIADKLIRQIKGQNLSVAGSLDTIDALMWGEVDTLVMCQQYNPDPGWHCKECRKFGTDLPEHDTCNACGMAGVEPIDIKEMILRLASQQDIPIEIVEHSDPLLNLGGVGCLLRL